MRHFSIISFIVILFVVPQYLLGATHSVSRNVSTVVNLQDNDEIKRLKRKVEEKGYTLVPLDFYLKNGIVKVTLGLCKGKKLFDKRASIKDRDVKREIAREFRNANS